MTKLPAHAALLTDLALIEGAGSDAAAFLQAQLSNDIRAAGPTQAQLSSWNSAKGRMLAVLHVVPADSSGERWWLELHRSILDPVLKKLRMFVLRSKVTLRAADDRAIFGISGPGAAQLLANLGLPDPPGPLACAWSGESCVVRRIGPDPRYSIVVPALTAAAMTQRFAGLTAPPPDGFWRRGEMEAGVPTLYPATQDRFVAQMCNLDTLGGISFSKGCFPGQEVVARVHYRGAVKRHLELARVPGAPPAPGADLVLADGRGAEVVDAVPLPDGNALVQAVVPART